jgi:murein DD-endopeptidase MepM/ murein hydrolase activator NlpD
VRRALLALAALCLAGHAAPVPAQGVELEGTWYVLVHYKDDHAINRDEERWEDRVWVFERDGQRLRWTEYPIVVFEDDGGRFERRQSGQYARVLHFWEPSEVQLADIRDGLKVNTRGSKTKTLRGSDAKGWSSGQRSASASASVVTYTETWSVGGLPDAPVFTRSDVMGGGRTDSLEGVTRYATSEVSESGNRLSGRFERDGSRHGTFRMMRSAGVGSLEEKTLEQRQADARRQALEGPGGREAVRALIEEQLDAVGIAISPSDLDQLTDTALRLDAQGVEPEGIQAALTQDLRRMLRDVAQPAAVHDDTARYRVPFDAVSPGRLLAYVGGGYPFSLATGTRVVAAREGVVTRVVDGWMEGASGLHNRNNSVYVRHADGTYAQYSNLRMGAPVKVGESVQPGQTLGAVGSVTSGLGDGSPTLYFAVFRLDGEGRAQPVAIRFEGPDPEGIVPEPGKSYGGR